jgi:hypothetical protein
MYLFTVSPVSKYIFRTKMSVRYRAFGYWPGRATKECIWKLRVTPIISWNCKETGRETLQRILKRKCSRRTSVVPGEEILPRNLWYWNVLRPHWVATQIYLNRNGIEVLIDVLLLRGQLMRIPNTLHASLLLVCGLSLLPISLTVWIACCKCSP